MPTSEQSDPLLTPDDVSVGCGLAALAVICLVGWVVMLICGCLHLPTQWDDLIRHFKDEEKEDEP